MTPPAEKTDPIKDEAWYNQPAEEVLEKLDSTAAGLSVQEAENASMPTVPMS